VSAPAELGVVAGGVFLTGVMTWAAYVTRQIARHAEWMAAASRDQTHLADRLEAVEERVDRLHGAAPAWPPPSPGTDSALYPRWRI